MDDYICALCDARPEETLAHMFLSCPLQLYYPHMSSYIRIQITLVTDIQPYMNLNNVFLTLFVYDIVITLYRHDAYHHF
jgi:hypothetical protein